MDAVVLGIHVLDVLGRPIESIPQGQGGQLVEEIRFSPAGAGGGTAITLAKLGLGFGAPVRWATIRSATCW